MWQYGSGHGRTHIRLVDEEQYLGPHHPGQRQALQFRLAAPGATSGTYGFSAHMKGTFFGIVADSAAITIATGEMRLQTGSTTTGNTTITTLAQRFALGRKAK